MNGRARLESLLNRIWYEGGAVPWWAAACEQLFRGVLGLRRWAYALGLRRSRRLPVPVVVVGNLTAGGTGKTPLVAWLANELRQRGWQPGIITRGYGAAAAEARRLPPEAEPAEFGDEPVWLAHATGCPVAIGRRRADAGQLLVDRDGVDLLLSDDGLQHWSLARDVEIVVIDGQRGFGNQRLLPAGPLREPLERLKRVDAVVVNGGQREGAHSMQVRAERALSLRDLAIARPLSSFTGQRVHAVAGIGNPRRFFDLLRSHGIVLDAHPFPDHHPFERADLDFGDDLPVLITEKDAGKCAPFADGRIWVVPIDVELPAAFADAIHRQLHPLKDNR
jgi:tetraacyldisaccharide 4'-kinase